jgi:hypothetical protein
MSHCLELIGVAALLCVLGCTHDGFLAPPAGPVRSGIVVTASVARVSETLQNGLCDAEIAVLAKREGRNERLVGTTKSGKMFCLQLRPGTAAGSESTVVSVEWGRDPDEQFWRTVVKLLENTQETLE